jgi:biotin carboxyl carrier protein
MSTALLVTLTVVEIVALVVVLALFVILITRRLRSLANTLGEVSGGVVGAIQGDVFLIGAGAAILNRKLNAIAGALPAIAEKAESLPLQQTQAQASQQQTQAQTSQQQTQAQTSQQTQEAPTSGTDWRPAVSQDPAIRRR